MLLQAFLCQNLCLYKENMKIYHTTTPSGISLQFRTSSSEISTWYCSFFIFRDLQVSPWNKQRLDVLESMCQNSGVSLIPAMSTLSLFHPETSGKCAVCEGEEELFSCDTCSRFFHENCHVQPKDANSYPWSCIFCKIKALQEKCPESQPRHQESEVLKRQMLPDEQLVSWNVILKLPPLCSHKRSSTILQGQKEWRPRQTAIPCYALIISPDTKILCHTKFLFRVCFNLQFWELCN